jgi:photosystem II stability/assembly factor-like uncharacterized protein
VRSTRVFRWDKEAERYELVDDSGIRGHVAWASVTGPGHYVVAAAPVDPGLVAATRAVAELQPLLASAEPELAVVTQKEVLELVAKLAGGVDGSRTVADALQRLSVVRGLRAPGPPAFDDSRAQTSPERYLAIAGATIDQTLVLQQAVNRWTHAAPWESLGPSNVPGRVTQLAIVPGVETSLYAATDGGGVWKGSERRPRGASVPVPAIDEDWRGWEPLTDRLEFSVFSRIAIEPSRPSTIWALAWPSTLLRSDDAGRTWRTVNSSITGAVWALLPHPTQADTVFLATGSFINRLGGTDQAAGAGLIKIIDGGGRFTSLLSGDITDAVLDRANPQIMYVAVRDQGVYKTSNGRDFHQILPWSYATNPSSHMIKVAISEGDDSTRTVVAKLAEEVFVHRQGGEGPIHVSTTDGDGWINRGRLGIDHRQGRSGQEDWCHVAAVDPFDHDHFLAGQQDLQVTVDGGATWTWVAGFKVVDGTPIGHPDQQHLLFDPVQRGRVYAASDGGVHITRDGGQTWNPYSDFLDCTSAYRTGVSGLEAVSGVYHQGIVATGELGPDAEWNNYGGGAWEGTTYYGDPKRPGRFYILNPFATYYNRPGHGYPFDISLTWANFPAAAVAVAQRVGAEAVLAADAMTGEIKRTLNGDVEAPVWNVEPGIPAGTRIVALAMPSPAPGTTVSPTLGNWCYAAGSTGEVYFKRDVLSDLPWTYCGRWDGSTGDPDEPGRTGTTIRALAVNPLHQERLYLLGEDKVARSTNSGADWTVVDGAPGTRLPPECHSLCVHPTDGRTLYAAADGARNVFVSHDEGDTWHSFHDNLPTVSTQWLEARDGWLYASTYGRGLWRRPLTR